MRPLCRNQRLDCAEKKEMETGRERTQESTTHIPEAGATEDNPYASGATLNANLTPRQTHGG